MRSNKSLKCILSMALVLGIVILMGGFPFPSESLAVGQINLVKNPGFENELDFWSSTGGTATYESDTNIHHTGSYSAKGIETNKGNLGRLYQDVTGIVSPGSKYKIGGWIKTEAVDGDVVIALDFVTNGGWSPADGYVKEIGYVSGTQDWTYYESSEFFLPPMPSDCEAAWFLFDFNAGKGTAWFDGVFLYEIASYDYSGYFRDEFCMLDMDRWDLSTGTGPGENYPTTFDPDNVITTPQDELQIRVPYQTRQGGQIVTDDFVSYGRYRARIWASSVDNTIQGFFVYAHEYQEEGRLGHREIDVEFGLTEHRNHISFGTWINGVKEFMLPIPLTFDPSGDYYEYGFDWYEDRVDFYVGPFRIGQSTWEISPDPSGQPLKLMVNNWVKDWPKECPPLPQDDSYLLVDWISYQPQYGELVCEAFSPVDISIIDPDGLVIDIDTNEITGATYAETDVDNDGDLDDVVTIPQPRFGDYKITVVPDAIAELTETYTLQVVIDGQTIVLAENTPISEIPHQGYVVRCDAGEITQIVPATTDFRPDTLNLSSKGKAVTIYIELPIGYDVGDIDMSSIMLNGVVPALSKPIGIGDYDGDGIPDMMIKFARAAVQNILSVGEQVQVTVTGQVAGIAFEGSDIIRVIDRGHSG